MVRTILRTTVLLAAVIGVAVSAEAATINLTFIGGAYYPANSNPLFGGAGVSVSLHNNSNGIAASTTLDEGGGYAYTKTGSLNGLAAAPLGVTNSIDKGAVQADILAFCLQLNENHAKGGIYEIGNLTTAPVPTELDITGGGLDGSGKITADTQQVIEWLWTDNIVAALSTSDSGGDGAAAFQLAMWKLEYDGRNTVDVDWTTGHVQASGTASILAQAEAWILAASAHAFDGSIDTDAEYLAAGLTKLAALTNPSGNVDGLQDLITPFDIGGDPFISVPEPASLAVWAVLAFGGVLLSRRRKTA